jgi:uncharacterized protein YecE (DUF72 family)
MGKKRIHIGTSGWHYGHWKGAFYPDDLSSERYLPWYAGRFSTVEINNTFYKVPREKTLREWRGTVGKDFIFSVKANRYITHMKKLKDPRKPVSNFLDKIRVLEDKIGPILFQLPPNWRANPGRLKAFLECLPGDHRYAFEFRDPSWFDDRVYSLLARKGAAFCIYDFDRQQSPKEITSNFVYIRLHGPDGPYKGKYSIQNLAGWAGALSAWIEEVDEIFCYFDNDEAGFAAQDALRLQKMIED